MNYYFKKYIIVILVKFNNCTFRGFKNRNGKQCELCIFNIFYLFYIKSFWQNELFYLFIIQLRQINISYYYKLIKIPALVVTQNNLIDVSFTVIHFFCFCLIQFNVTLKRFKLQIHLKTSRKKFMRGKLLTIFVVCVCRSILRERGSFVVN